MAHPLLIYAIWESPIGQLGMASTQHGLCRISIGADKEAFTRQLAGQYGCQPVSSESFFKLLKQKFTDYFEHGSREIICPLDLEGATVFQRKVWKKLADIPYGETRPYQWVAEQIGHPKAYRAVGHANSLNPFPIIIPCHRVIKADGRLGGYSAGSRIKKQLLKLEGFPL
jgi:methylated-DNA-[protein]-cysteine S-methyltransferase